MSPDLALREGMLIDSGVNYRCRLLHILTCFFSSASLAMAMATWKGVGAPVGVSGREGCVITAKSGGMCVCVCVCVCV